LGNLPVAAMTAEELARALEAEAEYRGGNYANADTLREAAARLRELDAALLARPPYLLRDLVVERLGPLLVTEIGPMVQGALDRTHNKAIHACARRLLNLAPDADSPLHE
ncbi:MAG: hypothetical protein WA001_02040, partial [Patescibacteria group bacterium]